MAQSRRRQPQPMCTSKKMPLNTATTTYGYDALKFIGTFGGNQSSGMIFSDQTVAI